MTDKGGKKGTKEVAKKGKKIKFDDTVQVTVETQDAITCCRCKVVFTNKDAKFICCDRCDKWHCTKYANITDKAYNFLASKDAKDLA